MQALSALYRTAFGCSPDKVEMLTGAGSNRRYCRLAADGGPSVVGCIGTSRRENHAFLYLARHFRAKGLPVPEILAADSDEMRYLQTDLGHTSLFDLLRSGRESGGCYDEEQEALVEKTLRLLAQVQVRGGEGIDYAQLLPPTRFDARTALFDLNYFKYCFLRTTDTDYDELLLQDDLEAFAAALTEDAAERHFLYRDFQARNVMVCHGEPFLIDFQSGRQGPPAYDVAAFLWQASARYPQALRERAIAAYEEEMRRLLPAFDTAFFRLQLRQMVLFRLLQVLGAYGLRGRFERKQHFLDSIPPALCSLKEVLETGACDAFPHLKQVLQILTQSAAEATPQPSTTAAGSCKTPTAASAAAPLVVRVFSFSYKRGIPADESGNGGGYVFDCRAPHNPGRYEAYKKLTGLDEPVIRFLEDDGEIQPFLESVYRLADFHTQRYIDRGFTSLMFSFGCTGGQHRSVYCAQHLAEHLSRKFGIEVRLCHREQQISQVFSAR